MKIYGDRISGNCLKVRRTADLVGLEYDWVDVDILAGETRTAEFLAINPAGQVPAVVLSDGRALAQSNAIIRFLAAGSALLPDDPFEQALVDEWLFWEQYSHEPYVAVCRFQMLYLGKSAGEREPFRVERGDSALDHLDASLSDRSYLTGSSFTIADIALHAYTSLAHEGGFDLSGREHVRAWLDRCEGQLQAA